ncbi:dihydrofolate reductase [Vibrio phage helene 12B3]|uniref:dihydrofolate reductase n=1 Tax=Vibrio phage helene 12B3 TaxID=573173 RepID=UPI0002C09DE9|nr:dihydrofolate reductase [Vibrio phage helene 12B3]YP_009223046.1 dihydrofolate reductase [Vibrio phage eugene 12A10]AGG57948.1 dihydrofolate reductase [Vibrio phage helene 12B3]AGN51636.1 dihydrofolate reductase [Vibrio phage eugene 12A10]
MIAAILCVGLNGELGDTSRPDGLPWDNPEDLKFFKTITETNTVLMGGNTFDSIPFEDGFPRRKNLILSKNREYLGKRCLQLRNKFEFLQYAEDHNNEEIFIIGGKSIYEQLHPYCDRIYLTRINKDYPDADVKISLDFLSEFVKIEESQLNEYSHVEVWERKK